MSTEFHHARKWGQRPVPTRTHKLYESLLRDGAAGLSTSDRTCTCMARGPLVPETSAYSFRHGGLIGVDLAGDDPAASRLRGGRSPIVSYRPESGDTRCRPGLYGVPRRRVDPRSLCPQVGTADRVPQALLLLIFSYSLAVTMLAWTAYVERE